jgi:putative flippase GtrA
VIVTVDADGQHLPDDVQRVAEISAARPEALVLGSRALEGDIPARSRFGNTVTRHVYSAATGVRVHDTQTGLRAFHRSMIPRLLEIEGDRYEYEINMLMMLATEGVPVIEERIETVYEDNNSGSHFRTVRDAVRVYKEILKFSASSFVGFLIDYGMYALLLAVTGKLAVANSLIVSNIGARVVSSAANYTINRKLVFRSNKKAVKSALQYFALAALILAGNTAILSVLVGTFGIGRMAAKVITEIILFSISWLVQKYVIFYTAEENEAETVSGRMKVSGASRQPARLSRSNIRVLQGAAYLSSAKSENTEQ